MKNMNQVSISNGNSKMGLIPSVSLPPIKTCVNCKECSKDCYAAKLCRIRKTVREAYENNLRILKTDPKSYWIQVRSAVAISHYFRFHVSGDILNDDYFAEMVDIAESFRYCEILCFTKNYKVVNRYLANYDLPENLHVIFSAWGKKVRPVNPYNLPVSEVIFPDTEVPDNWKICGGNCTECACRGIGCWTLRNGETIAFYKH